MYRLATLLALLMALVAAGCGGSGDDSDSATPSAVAQADESAPSDDGSASAKDEEKKKTDAAEESSDDEDKADDAPQTEEELHEAQAEAFEELSLKRKSDLIKAIVGGALPRFGLKLVDLEVRNGGHAATAVVARRGVCNFVASQEPNLLVAIQEGAPALKSLRLEVAGTGQELGYYVLRCKQPEIPNGAGRVVLEHSGVGGPYTSKRFTIESKRWALEWVNEAKSLAVIVQGVAGESKGKYFKPVGSQKRESGRYEYTGRGTFQIKAYGEGGWTIRVKEIR
jgi:hypothetical protein